MLTGATCCPLSLGLHCTGLVVVTLATTGQGGTLAAAWRTSRNSLREAYTLKHSQEGACVRVGSVTIALFGTRTLEIANS